MANREVIVVAVSKNVGSFGHRGVIVMDAAGHAWEMHWSVGVPGSPPPARGDILTVDIRRGEYGTIMLDMMRSGIECVRRLTDAPPHIVKTAWGVSMRTPQAAAVAAAPAAVMIGEDDKGDEVYTADPLDECLLPHHVRP